MNVTMERGKAKIAKKNLLEKLIQLMQSCQKTCSNTLKDIIIV
jgi:hypothetical protein